MSTEMNRRVVLRRRPVGAPRPDDFELIESPLRGPGEGEILCRTIYLSLDPYMRGRISGVKSYAKGVDPGDLMVGGTVSEVVESRHAGFAKGDLVAILFGHPLSAPPRPDRSNKVLWVTNPSPSGPASSAPAAPPSDAVGAVVEARLEGSEQRVRKELVGLGPSILDLPAPGCWHLDVTWGPYTDSLSLRYVPS